MSNDCSHQIIVSRYTENIDWLADDIDNCIVYNKGPRRLNISQEYLLPNIGKESHTYLYHIIENYNTLADINIFAQGDISVHHIAYKNGMSDLQYLRFLGDNINCQTASYQELVDDAVLPDWNRKQTMKTNPIYFLSNNYKNNTHIIYKDWFEQNIKKPYIYPMYYGRGNGIFAVTKKQILRNPIDFYQELIEQVDWHIDPVEGHFFERAWYHMFIA